MKSTRQSCSSGGKGNLGLFIERDPNIYAAGKYIPVKDDIKQHFQQYSLQDEVDALKHDSITPLSKPKVLLPLRRLPKLDVRNAGPFTEATQLLNPPIKTKFQTLVEDFKNTAYNSYWKREVGKAPDPTSVLPAGFDIYGTTMGKKTAFHGRLYDIVMPKEPSPEKENDHKSPSYQLDRKYCKPAFDPNVVFGQRQEPDRRGTGVQKCLTDKRIILGTASKAVINNAQADFLKTRQTYLGHTFAPNENVLCVPNGFSFGITKQASNNNRDWMTMCSQNPKKDHVKTCLSHLNTLRKCLSKRYDGNVFRDIYLKLKYLDKINSDWLPKEIVYKYCNDQHIRFDPKFLEPLLSIWNAFDGSNIEYKIFVRVINYREPSPDLPKISDLSVDCLNYQTTYSEMVDYKDEYNRKVTPMAGISSGRYLDLEYPTTPENCCKADRFYLPQESDMKSCLSPSVFTNFGVSHRDMYKVREPEIIRKILESSGKTFTDHDFEAICEEAGKYHSQGALCLETFRRAMITIKLASI